MESIDKLLRENPNTNSISLEFRYFLTYFGKSIFFSQISNLGQLLPKLNQFKKLKEVNPIAIPLLYFSLYS